MAIQVLAKKAKLLKIMFNEAMKQWSSADLLCKEVDLISLEMVESD